MAIDELIKDIDNPYAALAYAINEIRDASENASNPNQDKEKLVKASENEVSEERVDELEARVEALEKKQSEKDEEETVETGEKESGGEEEARLDFEGKNKDSGNQDESIDEKVEDTGSADSKESKEDTVSDEGQVDFTCPQCGEMITVSGWSNHIKSGNLANRPNHETLYRRLQIGDDDRYYIPHCNKWVDSYGSASDRVKRQDLSIGEYLYEYREDLGIENMFKSVYDEDGNLKAREKDRRHIEDYPRSSLQDLLTGHLDEVNSRKEIHDITEELFQRKYESGSPEYNKVYNALETCEDINSGKNGLKKEYWTGEDPEKDSPTPDSDMAVVDRVANIIGGDNNYRVLLHAVSKLAPREEGGVSEVSYYGGHGSSAFTSVFSGADDLDSEDAWKYLNENSKVKSAISNFLGDDFELKSVKDSDLRSKDPTKSWKLKIFRKSS